MVHVRISSFKIKFHSEVFLHVLLLKGMLKMGGVRNSVQLEGGILSKETAIGVPKDLKQFGVDANDFARVTSNFTASTARGNTK